MYLLIYIFFKITSSIKCANPNTVLAFNGECVCIDGFPYGDPNTKEGCFRCNEKCHRLSKCEFPGKCNCISPYHGDGILDCSLDVPHIISISPNNGTMHGGTNVQIYYTFVNKEKNPDTVYCRFGSLVVRSESISDTVIICKTPPHRAKPAFVSISFDTLSWSKEDIFFNFVEIEDGKDKFMINDQNEIENDRNRNIGLYSIGFISIILLSSLLILTLKRYQVNDYQLPFALRKKMVKD